MYSTYRNPYDPSPYDSFLGIGKKAKERREVRVQARQEKKAQKVDNRKARADAKRLKAQAKLELAKQGIGEPSVLSEVGSTIGNVSTLVSNLVPGAGIGAAMSPQVQEVPTVLKPVDYSTVERPSTIGSSSQQAAENLGASGESNPLQFGMYYGQQQDKNKNLPFYIGGAVLLLLVIVLMFKK